MRAILVILAISAMIFPCHASERSDEPRILVFSGSMDGWAASICEILEDDFRISSRCTVVQESDLLSTMMFLPNTWCVVLAPMASTEIKGVSSLVQDFFQDGGAVVGFSPCTDIRSEPELASSVFPLFCNKSAGSDRVGNRPVNTYVVRNRVDGVTNGLPESFRLVGSGFLFASTSDGDVAQVEPGDGNRYVFWEEQATGAPLVVGFERPGSGRSVGFSACRVNEASRSSTYFGVLTQQEEFVHLLGNVVLWALQGSERYERLEGNWRDLLNLEGDWRDTTASEALETRKREKGRRNATILGVWVLAGVISALTFWKFALIRP